MAKMNLSFVRPEFMVTVDEDKCTHCRRCVNDCPYGTLSYTDRVVAENQNCTACLRCMAVCPHDCIFITRYPVDIRPNANWTWGHMRDVWKQALGGAKILTSNGNPNPYPVYWDHLLVDACQVTNPSIDPLREPMELRTYLGRKPEKLEFSHFVSTRERAGDHAMGGSRDVVSEIKLATQMAPQLRLETPIIFGAMSYGALSLNVHKALAKAAKEFGTVMNTGEGGLHPDLYPYADHIIGQVASGRMGVTPQYMNTCAAIEIKIGQGAKPGIGGHLPGEKVSADISITRMIPQGADAISPAPHHDIYSIEDLRQLIFAMKEATRYTKPVSVKIAAVHNTAAIAAGIARAGADIITIDGFRGGTGATPTVIRDHVGIPIELALASVDERLRQEGLRDQVSIIVSGSIRSASDVVKAIALGADACAIGSAALVALGCTLCRQCHTNKCAWGIATQRPDLVKRVDPDQGAELLKNLLRGWSLDIKEILGALGVNSIESLRGSRDRLRAVGLDQAAMDVLGVKHAGA